LKGKNIRVNAVCPGFIATDLTTPAINALEQMNSTASSDHNPLERFGEPIEVRLKIYIYIPKKNEMYRWLTKKNLLFVKCRLLAQLLSWHQRNLRLSMVKIS
jgi:NAD(P)-dependent dehydrogenase (short-subunit alcohol dehydrogenase family)